MGRRAWIWLSGFLSLVLLATACGPQAEQQPSGPVKLTMICRCVAGGVNNNLVKWLNESVIPGYTSKAKSEGRQVSVEVVQFGGTDEELKARLTLDLKASKGEDLMTFDGFWIPEFATAKLLKPLDQIDSGANDWEGWKNIPSNVQDLLRYDGKRYGVPQGTDARVIWFRKDIFQRAGLASDWQPKGWDDILSAAATIKRSVPGVIPMQVNAGTAMGEATTMQGLYPLMASAGNFVYDFKSQKYVTKSPGFLDALKFYKSVYLENGYGDPRLQLMSGQTGRNLSFEQFRDGKLAMLWESDFLWRSVLASGQFKLEGRDQLVGWAKVPAKAPGKGYNGQDFVTVSGGTGWAINPNTKSGREAWRLLSYMFGKSSLESFQQIEKRIPPRTDVTIPDEPVLNGLTKLLPLTIVRPNLPTYTRVSQAAQLATQQVVNREMEPEQAQDVYAASVSQIAGPDKTTALSALQKK